MKKFMFSAVAMIAFAGSSMAMNNLNELKEQNSSLLEKDCVAYSLSEAQAISNATTGGLTLTQVIAAISEAYSDCETANADGAELLDGVIIKKSN